MEKIQRQDAVKQNLRYYFTGEPCPSGHVTKRNTRNRTCYTCAQYARTIRQTQFRMQAISKLGGKCKRCGFADVRALQIDHVNGGGGRELRAAHRRVYKQVLEDTQGKYQCLCANCNWIKRSENNENGQYLSLK